MKLFDSELMNHITSGQDEKAISTIRKNHLHAAFDYWGTLLHYAALHNNASIARYLIKKKALHVDSLNCAYRTPLMIAVEERSLAVVEILLEANANVDVVFARGKSALQLLFDSVIFDQRILRAFVERFKRDSISVAEIVDRLIHAGGCMYHAALLRDFEVMRGFLDRGVSVDSRSRHLQDNDKTALHLAVRLNDFELARWLLNNNANVDAVAEDAISPLRQAAVGEKVGMVRLLSEYGANPNVKNSLGFTALCQILHLRVMRAGDDATSSARDRCVEILLEHGAILQISRVNQTPILDLPLFAENPGRMKMLIAHLAMLDKRGMPIARIIMNDKLQKHPEMLPRLRKDFKKCRRLLELNVYGEFSMFNLLTMREHEFRSRVRNDLFMSHIKCIKNQLRESYPLYYILLKKRVSKGIEMVKLEDAASPILCKLMNRKYNKYYYFAREIVAYLSEKDLERLCQVGN